MWINWVKMQEAVDGEAAKGSGGTVAPPSLEEIYSDVSGDSPSEEGGDEGNQFDETPSPPEEDSPPPPVPEEPKAPPEKPKEEKEKVEETPKPKEEEKGPPKEKDKTEVPPPAVPEKTPEEKARESKARRETWEKELEKHYEMSSEDEELLREKPREFLPRAMARMHTNVVDATVYGVISQLPNLISAYLKQQETASETEKEFFSKWPALNTDEGKAAVGRLLPAYLDSQYKVGKTPTRAMTIQDVGAAAMVALRIPDESLSHRAADDVIKPPPPPAMPGGSGLPPPRTPEKKTPQQQYFEDVDDDETDT